MGKREVLARHWLGHVGRWRTSGLSRSAYCAREDLSVSAFGYWVSKANHRGRETEAEPLTLVAGRAQWLGTPENLGGGGLSLRTPAGWQLSFAQCPPASWLRELLEGTER